MSPTDTASELRARLQAVLGPQFTVAAEIGGGGMGRVFEARDEQLDRDIVIKVLPPELASGEAAVRFRREIAVVARLQHPHIVPILTAGEAGGLAFYTMPRLRGNSLRSLISSGRLAISEVLRIVHDVADALAYAHEHGVVHRDIKPDNVVMSGRHAVVTDFGVAKAICRAAPEAHDQIITDPEIGLAIGTPTYMAPEQAAADPGADHRADIYAFGVLAYELLAGHPPFVRRSTRELLAAHVAERPVEVRRLRADVPAALAALVMACLEKQPESRPASAFEVRDVLDAMIMSGDTQPAAGRRQATDRRGFVFAAGSAASLLFAFSLASHGGEAAFEDSRAAAPLPPAITIRTPLPEVVSPAPEPHVVQERIIVAVPARTAQRSGCESASPSTRPSTGSVTVTAAIRESVGAMSTVRAKTS